MMATNETTQQILTKCSRLKIRDYKKNSINELEKLVSKLEDGKSGFHHSLQPLIRIIQTIISSIDRTTLWKSKGKGCEQQQQLAQMACRLFKCLCQIDAECAASDESRTIIDSMLQWLRDDTDFHVTKSTSQDLHLTIFSCIEHYSLICKNQEDFLNELFSTSTKNKINSSSSKSCFSFHHHHRKNASHESLSIIDYSSRLVIYLLQSSLVSSSLLINQILSIFLIYAPISRFSIYLVNHTDFYHSSMAPYLATKDSDYFIQCIIDETARSQTDTNDRVFVFTHMINLLSEFVLHSDIEVQSSLFVPTFKHLFDSLVDCGTTVPLWYLVKCLSNLLTSSSKETNVFVQEMNRIGLINSITNYTITLIQKSTLGEGKMILKQLHHNVLISCLSILYNILTLDEQVLNKDLVINKICRLLFKSDIQQVRLMSCVLYSNILTQTELESDDSCHHLCEPLFSSIDQAFQSSNYYLSNQISLFTLVNCLKNLCTHKQFQIRIGKQNENIELLFRILRQFNSSVEQQEEIQIILESIWFCSFEYSCAKQIHSHDKYFAQLVQLAETNPNERIQQAAKGILWQLKQTISIPNAPSTSVTAESSQHIMLSYNHDSKDLVNKICQYLQNSGYRTWMDIDNMHGSTLDCMAHAIEQASVIIVCMSEKYKQSPNCQSEAEYAYRLKKPILPVLLQSKYKPDGWLGIILGTKLYTDFTKNDFDSNYKKLVKEIEATKN
ncbi:unnamed protein product [Rotaria socialis]|uniref:TIR domain-containing protein n=3 Tax=Rotaria socialis TaxID=392032 RepID=A0A820F6Y1_9BILA|nr:unnamed protein product [Rotaria socialis]CAF3339682.1 unnamed protein product [Rotaria socialis]CAF3705313.1 unnamed protein product [Rotaria socialis]CAF4259666.1 unnamed protein product [Rotaria socialis]CAF4330207.1 unnamed protein product [Rotaria socialis]